MSNLVIPDSLRPDSHGVHPAGRLQANPCPDERQPDHGLMGARVLLLRDQPGQASDLVEVLRQHGCHVTVVRSSCQFFRMALQMRPDLIVLHLMSARIDGPALCSALKSDASAAPIPVIFVTRTSGARHRLQSLAAGAVDHVQAPFDWREVLLRMAIHRRGGANGPACRADA